jgi:hypothetical protein
LSVENIATGIMSLDQFSEKISCLIWNRPENICNLRKKNETENICQFRLFLPLPI